MATATRPRVSVLLPVQEGEHRASAAAASCLSQSGVDVDIVVVHDGTASDEAAAVAAQDAERVQVLAHPAQGLARALDLGVAVARGEWIVALASHESWRVDAMAEQIGRAASVDGAVGVLDGAAEQSLLDALLADVPLPGGSALLRTAAVRAVGAYDPSLRFAHHLDLWLRLLAVGELVVSSSGVLVELSRAREEGEVEPEATRRERATVLSQALSELRPAVLAGPGDAPEVRLAAAAVRTGLPELRPLAIELLLSARAAGATFDLDVEDLRTLALEAPRLAGGAARGVSSASAVPRRRPEGWLRVALEVGSLDRGGLENVVADLALELGDAGIAPILVCTERGGARAAELRAHGIPVVVLRSGDREREIGDVLDAYEVDLLNPHFSTTGIRPAVARGIPVVPTLHNAYAWVGASAVDDFRVLDSLVTGYTAVSQFVADFSSRRFGIDPSRIHVIPNAHRRGGGGRTFDRTTARRELEIADDVELILQVGRVDPIKCQLALLDAVSLLRPQRPRVRAWIAGSVGDATYAARVEDRVARAGLEGVVSLLGQRDDVDRLLAAADVLAMPSIVEGLSLSVIEALAAGVPAVLTRTGDAAALLGGEGEGALPGALIDGPAIDPLRVEGEDLFRIASADHPSHATGLAHALGAVLDDLPAMRERARRRGHELASAFSPEGVLRAYADLFGRVVASGGAGHRDSARRRVAPAGAAGPLREAVVGASRGLDVTLQLAREREQAARQAGALSYELTGIRRELDATASVADQLLNKLRLTHRLREALATIQRKVRG